MGQPTDRDADLDSPQDAVPEPAETVEPAAPETASGLDAQRTDATGDVAPGAPTPTDEPTSASTDTAPDGPAPSAAAVRRLQQLAHPAWAHPPAAYDAAVGLATLDLADLLALLAHPPEAPATALGRVLGGQDPALWTRCAQVWACLGLLHHRTDEPWAESTRRRVLLDLVWGVEDWVTEAALFALVTAAWVDPAVRPDVARVVAERLADVAAVARTRAVPIALSLAHLALASPALDPETAALATSLTATRPAPRPRSGLGLGRLWRRLRSR